MPTRYAHKLVSREVGTRLGTVFKAIVHLPIVPRFVKHLLRFRKSDRGNYLIITALILPVLLGFLGLAIDVGSWLYARQIMQGAADSAALSSAVTDAGGQQVEAKAITATYGFVNGADGVVVTVNQPPLSGNYAGASQAVEVILSQPQPLFFSSLWVSQPTIVAARAVATSGGGGCLLALDGTANSAISGQGTAQISLAGCSAFTNSRSSTAISIGGSATLSAASVNAVGGISGKSKITTTNGVFIGAASTTDPYAGVAMPSYVGCDQTGFTAQASVTIQPGVYCGGMTINSGANVTLMPGLYFIDQGTLRVNSSSTITGQGVTLIFTSHSGGNCGTAIINGNATVNLSAPTSGPTAGIVLFGDRNMAPGTGFALNGGSTQIFGGAVYLPKAAVDWSGGANTALGCTQIIVDTITFKGNSNFAANCNGYGTTPFGFRSSTLVE